MRTTTEKPMNRMLNPFVAFLWLSTLGACDPKTDTTTDTPDATNSGSPTETEEEVDCSADAWPSVRIFVRDQNGTAFSGDNRGGIRVLYQIDGGDVQTAEDQTDHWVAGLEQVGQFSIFAEYRLEELDGCLWSDSSDVIELDVTEDECHVITQEVNLVVRTDLSDC
jgi:hypothetical protein